MLALLAALALLGGCAALDQKQREWIFQPSRATWSGAQTFASESTMQDVWIRFHSVQTNRDEKLHAIWLPADAPDAPVILYLHGARWDVLSSAGRIARVHDMGFSVLGVDYRGFGKSSGELPSEAMAYEDAQMAWDWLREHYPDRPRFIYGHSLGGAIAVDLAARERDQKGLIVEGTFTSIPQVFGTFKWGWLPLGPLITQRFDSVDKIALIHSPLLVIHGMNDSVIPYQLGENLYEHAIGPKRLILVPGGTHHSASAVGVNEFRSGIQDLFGRYLPKQQPLEALAAHSVQVIDSAHEDEGL